MITCKTCFKFAKVTKVKINTFSDEVIAVYGSCKHCGYKDKKDRVDYDDYEELGVS